MRIELKKKEPGVMWRCLGRPVERQAGVPNQPNFRTFSQKVTGKIDGTKFFAIEVETVTLF